MSVLDLVFSFWRGFGILDNIDVADWRTGRWTLHDGGIPS